MSPTNDVPKSDVRSAHHGFHLAERVKEGGHKRRDMKVTAKRRAYNRRYYRNHPEVWARSNARRKALRPIFTPKIDWADREAVRLYDRERNREYREAHPTWTAAKYKAGKEIRSNLNI